MCCICRLLCCCCCCCSDNPEVSHFKSLDKLPSKTMRADSRKVNPAVLQASTASGVKTFDLTKVFEIPNRKFRTEEDVIKSNGYMIDRNSKLGKGRYGTVFKAIDIKDKTVLAVKITTIEDNKSANWCNSKNELFVMEKTSHPHIIQVFTHFIIIDRSGRKNVFIFMRLAENTSLSDYIRSKKFYFEELAAKKLFAQIVSAVDYMHGLGIAHRDLKLGNILLDIDMNAMVSDFGLSRVLYRFSNKKVTECHKRVGTTEYMAPEILLMDTIKEAYDPFAADIWALGIVLYAMINRCYPFGSDPIQMIKLMVRFEHYHTKACRYYTASNDLDHIIRRILCYNTEDRIKMQDLVKHNWIIDEIQTINDKIDANNPKNTSLSE